MSLTSFLKNKDVREKFSYEFRKPSFQENGELRAEPKTKNYTLVGTAFDYMMRFYLQRINPKSVSKTWVAEHGVSLISDKKLREKAGKIISKAKKDHEEYIKKGEMDDRVIESCLCLAQLDPVYRVGFINENMGSIRRGDIEDMKNLSSLINLELFKSKKVCLLNPTFGEASYLVGGADVDLVIDDTIIDIKTTKFLKMNRNYLNQVIGYYYLYLIGGIDGAPKKTKIEKLGIYYSRHGVLYTFPTEEVINHKKDKEFIKWFKKRANG